MSYSFNVRGATKELLKKAISEKLADVVHAQPVHSHDRDHADHVMCRSIEMMNDPDEGHDIHASCNGSIWAEDGVVKSIGVGVNVCYVPKEV